MSKTLSMKAAQAAHEAWLAQHCAVVPADLDRKRAAMANDAFGFFRATCFRFAARFAGLLPAAAAQPAVPSIGDAHLENFGTWRDAEGRLVWGVNDLDEAAMLPWPTDLLRLATSALLTRGAPDAHVVQRALLDGYNAGLAAPRPFILDEAHAPMRDVAAPTPAARATFWAKIDRLPDGEPPAPMRAALLAALPPGSGPARFGPRVAGMGSLGRPRFVAIAEWRGGRVVREAKALVPSAWIATGAGAVDAAALAHGPQRAPDPWLAIGAAMVIRRLAPDSRKLNIAPGDEPAFLALLGAMGAELANFHGSAGGAAAIVAGLQAQRRHWLAQGAETLAAAVREDFVAWQKVMR